MLSNRNACALLIRSPLTTQAGAPSFAPLFFVKDRISKPCSLYMFFLALRFAPTPARENRRAAGPRLPTRSGC
jgi:hypothetical protein